MLALLSMAYVPLFGQLVSIVSTQHLSFIFKRTFLRFAVILSTWAIIASSANAPLFDRGSFDVRKYHMARIFRFGRIAFSIIRHASRPYFKEILSLHNYFLKIHKSKLRLYLNEAVYKTQKKT